MDTKDINLYTQYTTFSELKSNFLCILRHNIEHLQGFLLRCPPALSASSQVALEEQLAHLQRVITATTLEQLWIDSTERPSFLDTP
jgi:hypothetical protein